MVHQVVVRRHENPRRWGFDSIAFVMVGVAPFAHDDDQSANDAINESKTHNDGAEKNKEHPRDQNLRRRFGQKMPKRIFLSPLFVDV